jgi:outer membrane immunogenic protein
MKKLFFVASVLATGTVCASAADLPVKAPPIAPAALNWAGTYGGVSGGYGWVHSDQTDAGLINLPVPINDDGHYSVSGGLFGGTLGHNLQNGRWVYGLEGDLSWADIAGQSALCGPATPAPHPCGTKLEALGTFRGRAGYAAGANADWLLYATGGLAIGEVQGWDSSTPAAGSVWRAGWTAGVGVEKIFAPNWTAKLEYLHVDLGNAQTFNVVPGVPESISFRADIVRLGVNYNFGNPVTVSAPQLYAKARYSKAPVMAGNPWSGWYGGVNAGYVDGSRTINTDAVIISRSDTAGIANAMASGVTSQLSTGNGGFLGGAQFGYNYLLSPMFLAGFEADIQSSSLRNGTTAMTTTPIVGTAFSFSTNLATSRGLDYIGTIRGRVGATVTPGMLLYVTGGLAYGGVKSSTSINQIAPGGGEPLTATAGSFSDNRAGYTVGAGAEWMLMSKWSVKAEYLYYDLGSVNYGTRGFGFDEGPTNFPGFGVAAVATSTRVHFNGNIARVGLNYHLN